MRAALPTRDRRRRTAGFTLIELMITVAIIGVVMTIAIPTFWRASEKNALQQAVSDIVEGCSHARAQAILRGKPMAFVIRAEDGRMSVRGASETRPGQAGGSIAGAYGAEASNASGKNFSARLDDDIAIETLTINLQDRMESEEATVRFYPNGVSDEMEMVVSHLLENKHKIELDPITGLAEVEELK